MKAKIYQFEDYTVEVVHDPMTHLSRDLQDELVAECTELSRNSFGNSYIQEDIVKHCILDTSVTLFGRNHNRELFGYSSNNIKIIDNYCIIYLQSVAISKKFQGKGLRPLLHFIKVLEDINKIKKMEIDTYRIMFMVRTQNPRSYKYNARCLGMFPQPDGKIDPLIRKIGKNIVCGIYDIKNDEDGKQEEFDEKYFVHRGAYKSATKTGACGVYPEGIPYCNDDEINHYMNQHLDWRNGDALIQIGYYQEDFVNQMFEDAKHRMGFQDVYEVAPEELAAVAA